jgi:hypothetical protein
MGVAAPGVGARFVCQYGWNVRRGRTVFQVLVQERRCTSAIAAADNLTVAQLKVRYYVTVIPAIIIAQQFAHEQLASTLRIGGVLFMVGVVLSMATCLYNELLAKEQGAPSAA